jgi:hypothetical protein
MAVNQKDVKLRNFFRLVIVLAAWLVASLVPSNPISFYQSLFIASITATYEYAIIYIDNKKDNARLYLSLSGLILSVGYLFFSFLGFSNLITLDIETLKFHLSTTLPIPGASDIAWSYFITVYPMALFPGLIFLELFLKKPVVVIKSKQRGHAS